MKKKGKIRSFAKRLTWGIALTQLVVMALASYYIYKLADGSTVIVRPSGTEPKIKTYFTTKGKDLTEAQAKKDLLADACKPILS